MKKIIRVLVMIILLVSIAGCASLYKDSSGRELHPGHPGHEVH